MSSKKNRKTRNEPQLFLFIAAFAQHSPQCDKSVGVGPSKRHQLNYQLFPLVPCNSPREAAIYIVRLVNHKNMHVGMLALTVRFHNHDFVFFFHNAKAITMQPSRPN